MSVGSDSGDDISPLSAIRFGSFRHDLQLIDLATRLTRETSGQFTTERRLRQERGVTVDHSTLCRWVQRFGPELEKRVRKVQGWRTWIGISTKPMSVSAANGAIFGAPSIAAAG